MTWNRRYQVKSYLRSSLWIIPLVALALEQVAAALAYTLDTRLAWKGLGLGVTGAQAMFNAVITLTLSFIVFTFGSLLIAIQVAKGEIVAPCGVPSSLAFHSPSSITPALSHFPISRITR